MNLVNRLVNTIPSTDPEERRQQRLLSILLVILLGTTLAQEIVYLGLVVAGYPPAPIAQNPQAFWIGEIITWIAILIIALVLVINRYVSRRAARYLFVILLAASIYTNTPNNWTLATLTFALSISVFISSFLLRSYASFIVAGLSGVAMTVMGVVLGTGVYLTPLFTFFALATLSQIIARNLERTLEDLRSLNEELDQRVIERTHELAQALIREQAEASKNQAILEGIADGVIVFDQGGQAVVANPAIGKLLDRPTEQIVGLRIRQLMGDDVNLEDQDRLVDLLMDEALASLKLRWGEKTLSISLAPVEEVTNEVSGTVAVFRDFTREAEIARMKSSFIAIASHELRTPLNAILGYTEMLEQGVCGPLSERQGNTVNRIINSTGRLLSLANNLLDQAQIESGRLSLKLSTFAPSDLLDGIHGTLSVLARTKGIELNARVSGEVPKAIYGDQQRIHQILVNLINNAVKFTDEGRVDVDIYCPDSSHWALAVSDTGRGIPEEAQKSIFDPFRRADNSATRESKGAGLGLSIVKQLVELMEGDIELKSTLGEGSTFTVTLPISSQSESTDKNDKSSPLSEHDRLIANDLTAGHQLNP